MFILCPHCQFLVAIDPASGQPPAQCPRCGKPVATAPARGTVVADHLAPDAAATTSVPRGAPSKAVITAASGATGISSEATPSSANLRTRSQRRAPAATPANGETPPPEPALPPAHQDVTPETSGTTAPGFPAAAPPPAPDDAMPPVAHDVDPAGEANAPEAAEAHATALHAPGPDAELGVAPVSTSAPVESEAATAEETMVAAAEGEAAGSREPPDAQASPRAQRVRRSAPSFARPQAAPTAYATSRRREWIGVGALILLLVLQVLFADRARLAADAGWRAPLTTLCGVLHCRLPPWHEPEAFTLLARDVRPARAGVLHVSATFRNDARWTQAWPALRLALQDVDGRTVGARVLQPQEYLGARGHGRFQTQNGLASGQVAHIAFDVAEPGATVVAFTFDFR